MATPEQRARQTIDALLSACGWQVQDRAALDLAAARGVAVREFPLTAGFADYLLFVDRKAIGAVETKAVGMPMAHDENDEPTNVDGARGGSEKPGAIVGRPPVLNAVRRPRT